MKSYPVITGAVLNPKRCAGIFILIASPCGIAVIILVNRIGIAGRVVSLRRIIIRRVIASLRIIIWRVIASLRVIIGRQAERVVSIRVYYSRLYKCIIRRRYICSLYRIFYCQNIFIIIIIQFISQSLTERSNRNTYFFTF